MKVAVFNFEQLLHVADWWYSRRKWDYREARFLIKDRAFDYNYEQVEKGYAYSDRYPAQLIMNDVEIIIQCLAASDKYSISTELTFEQWQDLFD